MILFYLRNNWTRWSPVQIWSGRGRQLNWGFEAVSQGNYPGPGQWFPGICKLFSSPRALPKLAGLAWSDYSQCKITQIPDIHSGVAGVLDGKGTGWVDPGRHNHSMSCTHLGPLSSPQTRSETRTKTNRDIDPFLWKEFVIFAKDRNLWDRKESGKGDTNIARRLAWKFIEKNCRKEDYCGGTFY